MPRSDTLDRSPHDTLARMAQEWYIDAGGRVEGPVAASELSARAAAGHLGPADRVSADRVAWVLASTVPGLTFAPKPRSPLLETVVSGYSPSSDPEPDDPPIIDGYEIDATPLGTGACGVVYKARHRKLDRVLALKTVRMAQTATREVVARFDQEARALAGLHHPNIVAVYDCGTCTEPKDQTYFAMELLDGEDLGARLDRTGPLDERTAWLIARQTAAALAHAAKHGVIHRDIKPANLFLVPVPTGFPLPPGVPMVKVTDFGLALTRGGPGDVDQRQTAAGVLLGTPVYMAPEQFAGSDVDPRADIYSLGVTVFHVLTGAPPFDGRTVWEVMQKKSGPTPRLAPPVSAATADLVAAMMAADASARPANYTDLIARIDALPCLEVACSVPGMFGASGRMPAPPPLMPEPAAPVPVLAARSKRRVYAVAALALLTAAAAGAVVAGAFKRPATQSKAPDGPEPVAQPAPYTTVLYVSGSLVGWTPANGSWEIVSDDEQTPVLAGTGTAVRRFSPPPNFRVTLSLDPHTATVVEVQVAVTDGPPASATRWFVRLDRAAGEASFGKRVGSAGAFEPVGAPAAIPTPAELTEQGRPPYVTVSYERVGGKLAAWFRDQPLGGTPDAGLKTTEFRVTATGGGVRIAAAALDELAEPK